jgi:RHS repeat-associated protein
MYDSTHGYDKNGNIGYLKRTTGGGATVMDELIYSYTANQLTAVADGGDATKGFKDKVNTTDYGYDQAGNMITDANKDLSIGYNHLNLPASITRNSSLSGAEVNGVIKHYYAGATKVRMETYDAAGTTLTKAYDYLAGMVYVTNPSEPIEANKKTLDFIGNPEGRAILTKKVLGLTANPTTGDKFRFEYSLKDHLGNLRVSCRCGEPNRDVAGAIIATGQPGAGITPLAVIQEQYYDAWGLAFTEVTGTAIEDRFKYNGKELLRDLDLGWNDYGARMYDASMSRWSTIDPLAEKMPSYSPYSFAFNNPVRFIDPDGRAPVPIDDYFNKEGKYLGSDNAKTDNVRIIEQNTWDTNKTINENGKETIDNQLGNQSSQKFSEAKLDTKSALNVYQHYNSTDLTLKAVENKYPDGRLAGGMGFTAKTSGGKLISKYIEVSVQGNYQKGISDHANEITNTFVHEGQHYKDFKTLGVSKFMSTSVPLLEQRAILTQMNHPSFLGTRPYYQKVTDAYGKQFNYDPTKPIPPLK